MATSRLKTKDAYKLYNVIEIFCRRKVTKIERGGASGLFKLQITLAQLCKKHPPSYVNIQIPPLLGGNGVLVAIALFFGLNRIESNKFLGGAR
jgi:hypothetical protein